MYSTVSIMHYNLTSRFHTQQMQAYGVSPALTYFYHASSYSVIVHLVSTVHALYLPSISISAYDHKLLSLLLAQCINTCIHAINVTSGNT